MTPVKLSAAIAVTAAGLLAAALSPADTSAQTGQNPPSVSAIGDTATVVPGPEYEAGWLNRKLLGSGWRSLWVTPVDAPVFGLDRYEGGVEWTERGGGNQSITLHLESDDGWREYIFRSVNKFPSQGLPPELEGTAVGWAVGDLISGLFPAAPLLVPPFLEALDILHVEPVLRIMPDDPRLEVYRDTFAGMLGTVELQPNEAPDDEPGFAGSSKIKGTEEFFNDLEDSKAHRLDERELLAARLVDFLINDPDRTRDNMRWARFGGEGDYDWRPLPVDRDWAFVNGQGWLAPVIRGMYPKFVAFGPNFPAIEGLTFSAHLLDRRLLQRLTRDDFDAVASEVQAAITDEVIDGALAGMPERWQETDVPGTLRAGLVARRESLPSMARRFYHYLATDVAVYGTDETDVAMIERLEDGRVRVLVTWPEGDPRAGEAFYQRTFIPGETSEVRVHLDDGNDVARVVGEPTGAIRVRVVGGDGDDALRDEAGGGATHFYDSAGENRIVTARGTTVSRKEWDEPEASEGFALGAEWAPTWGGGMGWTPALDYGDEAGLIVGLGPSWTYYGFRRLPYHWQAGARVLYATGDNSFGVDLAGDYRFENSPLAWTLYARATRFDGFRFNGYGNDTDHDAEAGLVDQDRVAVDPALTWHIGWRERDPVEIASGEQEPDDAESRGLRPLVGRLDVGPSFRWSDPAPESGAPLLDSRPLGTASLARAGARVALALDRTDRSGVPHQGWRLRAETAGYTPIRALDDPFAQGALELTAYVPILGLGPHLAFRAGGMAAAGPFPVQHSAWVGGRTTLRGYRWQRFRGDASAYGSAELRIPVMPVELLLRWDLGVFGLADAGRVWFNGESEGPWHTGYGGGVWVSAFDRTASLAYAHGEEGRFYLQLSMPY